MPAMKTRDEPSLPEQRERLEELRRWEQSLDALRARRNDLEIECIAGDVALRRIRDRHAPMDTALAVDIEAALDRRRSLEERLERSREGTRSERDRLALARDALRLWLEAPREDRRARGGGRVRHVLFAVSLVAIIAALSVHVVFLVLLLPVAGAASFLSWSGQDHAWRRMGAKRRYLATRVDAPREWEEDAVRLRLSEIEARIEAQAARSPERPEHGPRELEAMLDAEHGTLSDLLARAGLDRGALDPETEGWIRELGHATRSRRELAEVQGEIAGVSRDVDELREALYRYLARRGAAGSGGRADTASLSAGLERLAARRG